jgi:hypothetical protein
MERSNAQRRNFFMKKNRFFVFGLMALIFALVLAGCKDNPKALAKETYDLTQAVIANPLKMVGGMVKAAKIKKKVDKLSPVDKQIYNEELARLTGQETGGLGILGGLSDADSASVGEALNAILGAIGMLNLSDVVPAAPAEETATEASVSGSITADSKSDDTPWVAIEDSELGRSAVTGIAFGRDKFAAEGLGNGAFSAYSTDGISWTDLENPFKYSTVSAIVYGKGKLIAGGAGSEMAYLKGK